jgi:regulator of protease activity HflC (stomatin/prohibitin superfamily)
MVMGLVPVVLCLVIVLNNQLYMYPPGQSLITTLYGVLRTKVGSCAEERPEVRISC